MLLVKAKIISQEAEEGVIAHHPVLLKHPHRHPHKFPICKQLLVLASLFFDPLLFLLVAVAAEKAVVLSLDFPQTEQALSSVVLLVLFLAHRFFVDLDAVLNNLIELPAFAAVLVS